MSTGRIKSNNMKINEVKEGQKFTIPGKEGVWKILYSGEIGGKLYKCYNSEGEYPMKYTDIPEDEEVLVEDNTEYNGHKLLNELQTQEEDVMAAVQQKFNEYKQMTLEEKEVAHKAALEYIEELSRLTRINLEPSKEYWGKVAEKYIADTPSHEDIVKEWDRIKSVTVPIEERMKDTPEVETEKWAEKQLADKDWQEEIRKGFSDQLIYGKEEYHIGEDGVKHILQGPIGPDTPIEVLPVGITCWGDVELDIHKEIAGESLVDKLKPLQIANNIRMEIEHLKHRYEQITGTKYE